MTCSETSKVYTYNEKEVLINVVIDWICSFQMVPTIFSKEKEHKDILRLDDNESQRNGISK